MTSTVTPTSSVSTAASTSATRQPTPAAPPANGSELIGTWRSTKDSKSTLEFSADGTACDIYGTDAPDCGTWQWVTVASFPRWKEFPGVEGPLLARTTGHGTTAMTLFYTVSFDSSDKLTLGYLDGGRILTFTHEAK
ncbi:hypothetical protein [Nocardia macrotermitis]|uniref:hypothetical protein n=1 Tax=Nocardia macrotermitis TaxID=2585198 RepID=UPI001295FF38|nr:hypothetical protein [Nocardia macrotermitis]